MSIITTILWVGFVTFLWVGITAGIWAMLYAGGDHPKNVSQVASNE